MSGKRSTRGGILRGSAQMPGSRESPALSALNMPNVSMGYVNYVNGVPVSVEVGHGKYISKNDLVGTQHTQSTAKDYGLPGDIDKNITRSQKQNLMNLLTSGSMLKTESESSLNKYMGKELLGDKTKDFQQGKMSLKEAGMYMTQTAQKKKTDLRNKTGTGFARKEHKRDQLFSQPKATLETAMGPALPSISIDANRAEEVLATASHVQSRKNSIQARIKGDFFAKRRKQKFTKVFESEKDNSSAYNF